MILGAAGKLCLALQIKETTSDFGMVYIHFGTDKIVFQDGGEKVRLEP